MGQTSIAISDCDHQDIEEEQAVFQEYGLHFCRYQCKTEDDLIALLPGHRAVINQYAPFTERVFAALPMLQMIVRYGVGVNNIDLDAATRHGVAVCNVPDYGVQEVAAHAFSMLLALIRKLPAMDRSVRNGRWEYAESIPIRRCREMTWGVVGLGRIGTCFAEMAHAMGGRILACDVRAQACHAPYVQMTDLKTLLRESDAISIHCNLESARNLLCLQTFHQMKPGAYLVNVSRGGIVNEADLAQALDEGLLAGAGLDVTCTEPLPTGSPLLRCKNLILTPHMAWYSEEASSDLKTKAAQEACRFLLDKPLQYQLNCRTEEA